MNGHSNEAATGGNPVPSPSGSRPSARDGIQRVVFEGDEMYPASSASTSAPKSAPLPASSSVPSSNGADIKGKGRISELASARNGSISDPLRDSSAAGSLLDPPRGLKREEFVRVVLQALRDAGYSQSADVLEAESGYEQEPPVALALKRAVLGGRWAEASQLLVELGIVHEQDRAGLRRSTSQTTVGGGVNALSSTSVASPTASERPPPPAISTSLPVHPTFALQDMTTPPAATAVVSDVDRMAASPSTPSSDGRRALFMLLRQKYLELLEQGQTKRALAALRSELARLAPHSEELHSLSGLIVCANRDDLYARANWDGAGGLSRQLLLKDLQAFIAPGVMLPPYRLGTLFEQAQRQQVSQCLYHSGGLFSLLEDHRCDRAGFPTVTTHILAQHTDEVWVMAFSRDGKFLASAGKDKQVVIWSIDTAPVRKCRLVCCLRRQEQPVQEMAWSPDDRLLVVAAENRIYVFDVASGTLVSEDKDVHKDSIMGIHWNADGSGFTTTSTDYRMAFWSSSGRNTYSTQTNPIRIFDFVITPDQKRMVAVCAAPDATSDPLPSSSTTLERMATGAGTVPNVPIHLTPRSLVIYDLEASASSPTRIISRRTIPSRAYAVEMDPDGKHVLLACMTEELQLWNIETSEPKLVRKYTGHVNRDGHLRPCFGGTRERSSLVVSPSEDGHVYVWHKDTGSLMEVLEGHKGAVSMTAWHPFDPRVFASCGDDHTIRIWQPASVADEISRMSNRISPSAPSTNGASSASVDLRAPQTQTADLPVISPTSPADDQMDMDMVL